jgi:2,5-diketo-D-gluconate reductase A
VAALNTAVLGVPPADRYIGVSNYSAELLLEMKRYATIFPAVNQLELHPRYSSPTLRKVAAELGMVLTGYGTGNSVALEQHPTVKEIADSVGRSPTAVVLRWTVQRGVAAIPRSGQPEHIRENLNCVSWTLSDDAMSKLDALEEDHPY